MATQYIQKNLRAGILATAVATGCSLLTPQAAQAGKSIADIAQPESNNGDRFIVKYRKDSIEGMSASTAVTTVNRALAAGVGGKPLGAAHLHRLAMGADVIRTSRKLDQIESESLIQAIMSNPSVEYVEADVLLHPLLAPNDPRYNQQWHYFESAGGINLPAAWPKATGSGVVVAVLDTGITNHSDLNANVVPGYDFISSPQVAGDGNGRDPDPSDPGDALPPPPSPPCVGKICADPLAQSSSSWHGTHVAGTVAAVTNNAKGGSGVAYQSKISPIRVLGRGGGHISDIADGIVWASGGSVPHVPENGFPAEVINMSLGGAGSCSVTLQSAIDGAVARGTTVVVAAGNSNSEVAGFQPANCANIVSVAANDRQGNRAAYSNFGPGIDVTAPGGETDDAANGVLSTLNSGTTVPGNESYAYYQGTSMAAPHVAGIVALMQSINPQPPSVVEALLKSTARPVPGACPGGCGAGIVDAGAAVSAAIPSLHLYAIKKNGVNSTEVHILDRGDGFQSFLMQTPTSLHPTGADGAWKFALGDYNHDGMTDLYAILKSGSATTEVHVLNGANNFQSFLLHNATVLPPAGADAAWAFDLGDFNRDGSLDLYAIRKQGAATTEVRVLDGADNFQSYLLDVATALHPTGSDGRWDLKVGDADRDGILDIYAINKIGAITTEVHILKGANNFQSFILQTAIPLHPTGSDHAWTFDLGDYNNDGVIDLYAFRKHGAQKTQAHVLDGANGFQSYLTQVSTRLHPTGNDGAWEILTGPR